jgi:hypothetical protein
LRACVAFALSRDGVNADGQAEFVMMRFVQGIMRRMSSTNIERRYAPRAATNCCQWRMAAGRLEFELSLPSGCRSHHSNKLRERAEEL